MQTLMMLSLGMQVIAQFGAYFDDFLAYKDLAVEVLGRGLYSSTFQLNISTFGIGFGISTFGIGCGIGCVDSMTPMHKWLRLS
jgi:hypothetical protein